MRKALNNHRGQRATFLLKVGAQMVGYVGDIEDHTLTIWSRPNAQGERRYFPIDDIACFAPDELGEGKGDAPRIVPE